MKRSWRRPRAALVSILCWAALAAPCLAAEPSPQAVLLSPSATRDQKIEAIGALLLKPSAETRRALEAAATSDADFAVREHAVLALPQMRDPAAIPTLVAIGTAPPSPEVGLAAHNAVFTLRQDFPLPDPPQISVAALTPILPGKEFQVEARVVSPVDRENVRIRFGGSKQLRPVANGSPALYHGPLRAGEPLVVRAWFVAEETGRTALPLVVRVSLNPVDATSWRVPLYLDVKEGGGTASTTPFPGWDKPVLHVRTLD